MTRAPFTLAAVAFLCGCAQAAAPEVNVVLSHGNCQRIEKGVKRIDYRDLAALRGTQLIDMSTNGTDDTPPPGLIAISLGPRPTPGYALTLAGTPEAKNGRLVIRVAAESPPADTVLAQVITNPCLVLSVTGAGSLPIRVEDATGSIVGELAPAS